MNRTNERPSSSKLTTTRKVGEAEMKTVSYQQQHQENVYRATVVEMRTSRVPPKPQREKKKKNQRGQQKKKKKKKKKKNGPHHPTWSQF